MEVQEAFWKTLLFRGKFSVRYFNESVKNVTYRILSKSTQNTFSNQENLEAETFLNAEFYF